MCVFGLLVSFCFWNGGLLKWLVIMLLFVRIVVVVLGCGIVCVNVLSLLNCLLFYCFVVVYCSMCDCIDMLIVGIVMWFFVFRLVIVFMFGLLLMRQYGKLLSDVMFFMFCWLCVWFYMVNSGLMFVFVMLIVLDSSVLFMVVLFDSCIQLILMLRLVLCFFFLISCWLCVMFSIRQMMLNCLVMWMWFFVCVVCGMIVFVKVSVVVSVVVSV